MSKFMSLIAKTPKRLVAAVLVLAAVVAIPALSNAWGPTRDTFTVERPADHVTFDSITNNPNIGDERNFVGIREVGSANTWYDTMKVQDGKEYYVRMYVHNNAASSLNLVAHDVTAKFNLPTTTGTSIQVDGFINSTNATPKEVYDSATFTGDTNFNLSYIKGSLQYENNKGTFTLPESIFTSAGAKLGYNQMDGDIPGCFQYSGFVTFKVKPQVAKSLNFTLTKKVSKHGANQWGKTYAAQPGETVDYLLVYKNVGTAQNDNVTFRDTLPTGLSYVANSGTWSNVLTQNVKFATDANLTNGTGINVGSYAPSANAYIVFSAKVAAEDQLPCGPSTLTNKAKVNTGGYAVEDTADVTVNRTCVQPPVYKCNLLTSTLVIGTQYKFNGSATASNGATVTSYTLNFGDGTAPFTGASIADVMHTYAQKDATYTARLTANITVDGKTIPVTSDACAVTITISIPKIQVCDLTTKKIVTINESDFDSSKYSKNLDDCKPPVTNPAISITKTVDGVKDKEVQIGKNYEYEVTVKNTGDIDLTNVKVTDPAPAGVTFVSADLGTISGNTWNYTIPSLKKGASQTFKITAVVKEYFAGATKNTACVDASEVPGSPDACDSATVHVPTPPAPSKIVVCRLADKQIVTINETDFDSSKYSRNTADCQTVTPPTELPHTGIGDGIVTTFGIGSLIASASYYIASRRGLGR